MTRVNLAKKVRPGEMLPRGYGACYWSWQSNHLIAYPLGLNLLVRAGRWCWYQLAQFRPLKWDELLREQYDKGYQEGRRHSFKGYDERNW